MIAGKCVQSLINVIVKMEHICRRRKISVSCNSQLGFHSDNHQDVSSFQNTNPINSETEDKICNKFFLHKSKESRENIYAHSILLSLPNYHKTTVNCDLLSDSNSGIRNKKEELKIFSNTVSKYSTIEATFEGGKDTENLLKINKERLLNMQKTIPDEGLVKILLLSISLVSADSDFFINYFPIFKVLRKASSKRLHLWTTDQILLLADVWYLLKYDFIYIHDTVKYLENRLSNFTPSQMVQYFFYLNIIRENKVTFCLDPFIDTILNDINIQELGIVCMGLFKTKTSVSDSQVVEKIVKKFITNFSSVTDLTLNAVLKFLRFNFSKLRPSIKNAELCLYLLKELQPYLQHINAYGLVQITGLGNSFGIYDEDILQEVYNIFFPILPTVRIKDIERLTYVIMNSRMYPKNNLVDFSQLIEKEIMNVKRTEEIRLYFHSFLSCVYYLACIEGKLCNELISQTLKMSDCAGVLNEYHYQAKGSLYERKLQLCQLERMATIDKVNSYEGYSIPKDVTSAVIKEHLPRMPNKNMKNLNFQESSLLMIAHLMKKLNFDERKLSLSYILPHIPFIGIVFCTSKIGEPMNIPEIFYLYAPEEIKYPVDSPDLTWNVIIFATKSSYLYKSFVLRGEFMVKIIQLQKIGFNVTIISYCDLISNLEDQKLRNLGNALADSSSLNLLN